VAYDATPKEQVELMKWALGHTEELLKDPNTKGWMGRWLAILKEEARNGFHPTMPKFGFGEGTSYRLIGDIVDATSVCGAVRHGAECFNFYFPQELDADFLVVWDGLDSPPWKTVTEPELRSFLLERAAEGFSFPLNPVWPVRDPGWLNVLHELQQHEEANANLARWFPPDERILERVKEIHTRYPDGFKKMDEGENRRRPSFYVNLVDCDTREVGNFAELELTREVKARWRRVRAALLNKLQQRAMAGLSERSPR